MNERAVALAIWIRLRAEQRTSLELERQSGELRSVLRFSHGICPTCMDKHYDLP